MENMHPEKKDAHSITFTPTSGSDAKYADVKLRITRSPHAASTLLMDLTVGDVRALRDAAGVFLADPGGNREGTPHPPAMGPDVGPDAVRELYAEFLDMDRSGSSSNDVVQYLDDWFTTHGFPTVIYRPRPSRRHR